MAVKKAVAAKRKPAKAVAAKKPAARTVKNGDKYECGVCGIIVSIDECGDETVSELVCCGAPMKEKKTRAKTAK